MKTRNPVTRDMIANPKRNQGRHKEKKVEEQETLADLLNEFEFEDVSYEGYKFVVHYTGGCTIRQTSEGYYAIVNATDHPKLPQGQVITSRLKWVNFDLGILETENSLYIPEEDKNVRTDS
jgi:hypothetical protein